MSRAVKRTWVLATTASLGLWTSGCLETVALLRAASPPTIVHEEEWPLPAQRLEGNGRLEPGECLYVRPSVVWAEITNPSAAPPRPDDVIDPTLVVQTSATCDMKRTPGGHGWVVRGIEPGVCEIAVAYTHPVTSTKVERTWKVDFAWEVSPPPPTPMPNRPAAYACDRVVAAAMQDDPSPSQAPR